MPDSLSGEISSVLAMTVSEVIDTTAAGDSFNGGYLVATVIQ
ncbi:hypothetical protein [Parendozoicomonas sp. Alg238-R29]|nr:hypothetical protein [Parendozoicomonas sp. Alg238-R29]